ncbi:MAG: hypothetical protein HY903_13945 [Deltaproteobacteria bacterium]|nr:hypothetical protein [Deltaproteobacteria bacterium]
MIEREWGSYGGIIIEGIDGNGTDDPAPGHGLHHVADAVIVTGRNLLGASVTLQDGGNNIVLTIRAQVDDRLEAILPPNVTAGQHTLTVSNSAGEVGLTLVLLKGVTGAACP